ncbi:MAG TPA: CRTAC1 family protein [Anaerolineae bacterium]|nr:CRTAC1 family protein [Anaerolineae bacterium]
MTPHNRLLKVSLNVVLLLAVAGAASASGGGVGFRDIAANDGAGIAYRRAVSARDAVWDTIKHKVPYTVADLAVSPMMPEGDPGVALFDFDRDGDLDIYVTNGPGANNSLYSNQLKQTGRLKFVDVAAAAGVGVFDQDSQGACFGDIDNDGDEDLYVANNNAPNTLFENQGNGAFRDITVSSGTSGGDRNAVSCALGDVNGDGLLDLFVGNNYSDWSHQLPHFGQPFAFNEHNQLFLNTGGNVFVDVSAESGVETLAGLPPEAAGAAGVTWQVALVDYDLDGDADIVASYDQTGPAAKYGGMDLGFIRVFNNDGTGHFTDVTFETGMNHYGNWLGLAFGDLNCDGHMDIFGTNVGDYGYTVLIPYQLGDLTSRWFLGQSDGTFTDPGVGALVATPFGWGTSIADYDNDGDPDIIYYGGSEGNVFVEASNPGAILRNEGCSANFSRDTEALAGSSDHTRLTEHGLAVGDLNNDGFVDIVSVSSFAIPESAPLMPFSVSYGSPFDADAKFVPSFVPNGNPLEFVWSGVEFPEGVLSVEINSGDNRNKWVQVETLGTVGLTSGGRVNRDGIGAVVTFTPKHGQPVMQPILGGSSHNSQDSLAAEFGLGSARKGAVEVLWPGGVRNRLYDVDQSERVTFPEIPCSFDADRRSGREYLRCVKDAIDDLVKARVLKRVEGVRFFASAMRAFYDR